MNQSDFLKQLTLVENHLYVLDPSFNKSLGFFCLLKNLIAKKLISEQVARKIHNIWQIRNKVVGRGSEVVVDDAIQQKVEIITQSLKI